MSQECTMCQNGTLEHYTDLDGKEWWACQGECGNSFPARYVVLRGIEQGNVFWSGMRVEDDEDSVRYLNDGTLAYEVLLITEVPEEAKALAVSRLRYEDITRCFSFS